MRLTWAALLIVLMACACVQEAQTGPVCNKPYILVGSSCCLDENGDGICDKDKLVCQKPYILVGGQCCLDENGNGVCDRDETTTTTAPKPQYTSQDTTTTTYPAATTTTIISQTSCSKVEDCPDYFRLRCDDEGRVVNDTYGPVSCSRGVCVYVGNREIAANHCYDWEVCIDGVGCVRKEDTTTTTSTSTTSSSVTTVPKTIQGIFDRIAERDRESAASVVTTTTLPTGCYDSKGGLKPTVFGNVTGVYILNLTYLNGAKDYCSDEKNLVMFFCQDGMVESKIVECDNLCIGGRCCLEDGRKCDNSGDCCTGSCRSVGMENHCIS